MNLVITFKRIKWCFNNNKRLSCMAHLAIHKPFIILLKHHFILLKLIKERKNIYLQYIFTYTFAFAKHVF